MLKDRHWQHALGVLAAVAIVLPVWADNPGSSASDETIARLEAQLAAQQDQLAQLQGQLVEARAQEEDAARVEAMKQQIREVLSEQEFRESLMPSMMQAGYDDGFFIKSSDEKFSMKVNGYMQFRWTHYDTQSSNRYLAPRMQRDDRTGFDIQRLRLQFSGNAWGEDLTYHLTMRAESPDAYDFVVHYAWINYRFSDEFQFRAGDFQLASTRSQLLADQYGLQFVDRGVYDAVFGLGNGIGVRFWGQLFDKRLEYFLDIVNSLNGDRNRTITNDPAELDGNPALLARLVWHAMGDDLGTWSVEGDMPLHDAPHLDLGFSYAFNEDQYDSGTTRIPFPAPRRLFGQGGFGLTNTNGCQINQFSFDAAFKYMGFSATGEYALRMVDPRRAGRRPFTPWWLLTRQGDTTVQHGAYVQVGYFLPIPGLEEKIEAVARVGGISTLANGQEGTWEYGAGLNYYIEGNNVKLQTDVIKVTEAPISNPYSGLANVNDDVLMWRVQLQLAF